jgi:hypothetical protein
VLEQGKGALALNVSEAFVQIFHQVVWGYELEIARPQVRLGGGNFNNFCHNGNNVSWAGWRFISFEITWWMVTSSIEEIN